jgi:hypothetical protein
MRELIRVVGRDKVLHMFFGGRINKKKKSAFNETIL